MVKIPENYMFHLTIDHHNTDHCWVRKVVMHDYITFRNSLVPENSRGNIGFVHHIRNEQDSIDLKIVKR